MSRLLVGLTFISFIFATPAYSIKPLSFKQINKKLSQHRTVISKAKSPKQKLRELEKMLNFVANLPMNHLSGRSFLTMMNLKTAFNLIDPRLVVTGHCDLIKAKTIFDLQPRGIASNSKKWPYSIKQSFYTLKLLCPGNLF